MKNFVFVSPNFPTNYWHFCRELKNNGLRVLGVGDEAYDNLAYELKESLDEYYRVSSLENYDEVYRAVAYFISRYGRIDYVESNNEYWLERDAMLRDDFNIPTGFHTGDLARIRYKSGMKPYYRAAGIKTARYCIADDADGALAFAGKVGYPVIVKPDNGVGATHTYKLENEDELKRFLSEKDGGITYIMEEFVTAEVNSYDAIINSRGEPIFEAGNITPMSIMDIVNNLDNSLYYMVRDLADDVREAGRAAVKSFGVRSRFVHFEFFRLTKDQAMGKKGEVVALEVNMRPSGGFTPDMLNYARSTDVYKIWADMIAFDESRKPEGRHYFCGFAGRRDGRHYALDHQAFTEKYSAALRMTERMPDALSGAMGNQVYIAAFDTQQELDAFYADAVR